jgi:uncharacterized protein YwqG
MNKTSEPTRRNILHRAAASVAAAAPTLFGFSTRCHAMATQGPFRTLEELAASLASAGVSATDQRILLNLALPSIALQSKSADDIDIPIGASKIGGAPDLPPDFPWPTRGPTTVGDMSLAGIQDLIAQMKARTFAKGYFTEQNYIDGIARSQRELDAKTDLYHAPAPLTFVMQLDLEALATVQPVDPDLPQRGRMLLFYDMIARPWFARDKDKRPLFQIVHDTTPKAKLERRTAPDPGYPLVNFSDDDPRDVPFLRNHMPAARFMPVFTYTLPDNKTQPMFSRSYAVGKDVPQQTWNEDTPAHLGASNRLLGWPELIQNDMRIELAARDQKQELPTSSVAAYTAAVEMLAFEAEKWVLLLQIGDYDNDVWDLNGLYFVWIKRLDLMARDFSKAEMIYQTD